VIGRERGERQHREQDADLHPAGAAFAGTFSCIIAGG
jgi:hypothetical protein